MLASELLVCCCGNISWQSNFKKKGLYWCRLPDQHCPAWWREHGSRQGRRDDWSRRLASRIASTLRKLTEQEELWTSYKVSWSIPSYTLPPKTLHLLQVLQPSPTIPCSGDQVFKGGYLQLRWCVAARGLCRHETALLVKTGTVVPLAL